MTAAAERPLRRILPLLAIPRTRLLAAALTAAATLGAAFALAAVSAWLVTTAWTMPAVLDLTVAVVGVRALGVSRGVLRWLDRMLTHDVALGGVVELRTGLFTALADRRPDAIARLRRGDLLARLGDDAQEMADHVISAVIPAAVAVIMGVVVVVTILPLSPLAAVAMLASLLLACLLAPWAAARAARTTQVDVLAARSDLTAAALETLDDATALRVAGRLDESLAGLEDAQRAHDAAIDRAAWPSAIAASAVPLAMIPAVLGSLLAAGQLWLAGGASAGVIGVLVLLPLSSFEAANALPAAAAQRARSQAAAARLADAIGPEDRERPAAPEALDAMPQLVAHGLDAGWSAEGSGVRGLDLALAPGTRLAITGASGAGKTTLLMTLAGLLDPVAGSVRADGQDPDPRRGQVLLFAEDAHVFATTVRENVKVARGDVDDEEILAALDLVGLRDWVEALPQGLATPLGPDGTTISGGERRRLLLVRALVRRAPVSLLDEPTEHLDAARGDELLSRLLAPGSDEMALLPAGHTVVVVTHRHEAIPEGTARLDLAADGTWTYVPGTDGAA